MPVPPKRTCSIYFGTRLTYTLRVIKLHPSHKIPFNKGNLARVPRASGVYIVFDLFGPVYVGRSRVDMRRRLTAHFEGRGNRNLAIAKRAGARTSLTFTYCVLPVSEQADLERFLIPALGVAAIANLRYEGLYEEDLEFEEV
jgi:hypothetical protein